MNLHQVLEQLVVVHVVLKILTDIQLLGHVGVTMEVGVTRSTENEYNQCLKLEEQSAAVQQQSRSAKFQLGNIS